MVAERSRSKKQNNMSNINKMDTSTVFEMFETINRKLDKPAATDKPAEPLQIDLTAVNTMTERFEDAIREVRKPVNVKHYHKIEITSNWVFLSLVAMGLTIAGLLYFSANQRQTVNQYKDNDLKYRYIRMQGQTNDENLWRLERQFRYGDSITIIREQVEKYEELVREQAEKIEQARRNASEVQRLQNQVETVKAKH